MAASNEPASTEALAKRCKTTSMFLNTGASLPTMLMPDQNASFLAGCEILLPLDLGIGLDVRFGHMERHCGQLVPYKANGFLSLGMKRMKVDTSVVGTMKVLSAMVVFPIWWMVASAFITWSLLSAASPLNELLLSHWLLLASPNCRPLVCLSCSCFGGQCRPRLHLKLYARLEATTCSVGKFGKTTRRTGTFWLESNVFFRLNLST